MSKEVMAECLEEAKQLLESCLCMPALRLDSDDMLVAIIAVALYEERMKAREDVIHPFNEPIPMIPATTTHFPNETTWERG